MSVDLKVWYDRSDAVDQIPCGLDLGLRPSISFLGIVSYDADPYAVLVALSLGVGTLYSKVTANLHRTVPLYDIVVTNPLIVLFVPSPDVTNGRPATRCRVVYYDVPITDLFSASSQVPLPSS